MAQNGPRMVQNDPKWPKNDPKWPTITPNGPKMTPGFTHFFRIFFFTEKAVPQTFSLLECMGDGDTVYFKLAYIILRALWQTEDRIMFSRIVWRCTKMDYLTELAS